MAHKLPTTESFIDSAMSTGGGDRWTIPTLYWPCKAWNQVGESTTGLGHTFVWGKLHDAYKAQTGIVTPYQDPPDTQDVGRVCAAYVLRTDQREDVEVRMSHVFQNATGDGTTIFLQDGNTYAGLGARLHGTAGTDFTSGAGYTEALRAPSGYWFLWGTRPVGNEAALQFQLLKITGPASPSQPSTINQLASVTWYTSGTQNLILPGVPQPMRFKVTTNGAIAELRGYWTPPGGTDTEVIAYDDSSSPYLVDGHPGFWLTTEILKPSDPSSYVMVHGSNYFEVRDGNDSIVVRDEWLRDGIDEMDDAGPDQAGRTGGVVTGQFSGDQAGADSNPDWVDRLVRHTSIAKLEVDNTPEGGFHIYTDPPASFYTQSIGGNFTLASGAGNRIFGLCARMAIGPNASWNIVTNATDKRGYCFAIHDLGSSLYVARIHRYSLAGNWLVIGARLLNKSGDGATIAVNTPNDLRLDIENINGGSFTNGNVKLTCSIDGWTIDEWTGLTSGVTEASDGGVVDSSSERVLSGTNIGFFARTNPPSTNDVFVNSITRPEATDTLDEREQPSIFIGGEKEGVTGTPFTVPFEWPLKTMYRDYGVRLRYESLHVHRHATSTNQRRGWKIRSDAATAAEVADLRDFFADQEGVEKPYNWTIGSETVTATLAADTLKIEQNSPDAYGFEFETWESLGPDYPTISNEDFKSGYVDAAVGGKERVLDPALGDFPLHPVWHFEDTFGTFTLTVNISSGAPLGGMYVRYELGGTAVAGTHYAVVSGSDSPLYIAEGGTTTSFEIATLSSGKWYEEKLLTVKIAGTSDGPVDPVENEWHVYIRPDDTTTPPSMQWFATTYPGLTAGADHIIQVEKLAASDTHEDDMAIYFEVVSDVTSDAVEGTDWDFADGFGPRPDLAYGAYTLSPSIDTGAKRNVLIRSYPSASGKSLKLNLWHDKDNATDMNRFTMTHIMDSESDNDGQTLKSFPREPADNAFGPAGVIPPKPWDYLTDPTLVDPFGGPVHVFRLREVARGAGYHRKSFNGQIFCAGHEEGVIEMPAYTRFSFYVRKPTNYDLPRFFRMAVRDRGSSLAAPQKFTGAIHSQATSNNTSTTLVDTSTNFVSEGVLSSGWEVNNLTQKWKAKVTGVATNTLTLAAPFTGSGDWDVNDWYACYEENGSYSGNPTDGLYEQNYAVHWDTQAGSGVSYDGATWNVFSTSANWNAGSDYGIEEETIRDANGIEQSYLRFWIMHNEDNADAIGNGQVRIWYPVYFGSGVSDPPPSGSDSSSENLANNINKALGVFWPMLETSASPFPTSAPGRYQPRTGYWWTPNGGAVIPAGGKRSTTLTWS